MKLRDANAIQRAAQMGEAELRQLVGPDPHHPGVADARLVAEQIPVWAIVGQVSALGGTTEPDETTIQRVARDYDISVAAVLAALLYYDQYREPIDARLEANAAALF